MNALAEGELGLNFAKQIVWNASLQRTQSRNKRNHPLSLRLFPNISAVNSKRLDKSEQDAHGKRPFQSRVIKNESCVPKIKDAKKQILTRSFVVVVA